VFEGTVGIVGTGKMGEAILRGLLQVLPKDRFLVSDPLAERRKVAEGYGVRAFADNLPLVREAQVVILAVKPKEVRGVLEEVASAFDDDKLLLSIVAGLKAAAISSLLRGRGRVIRAMPNLPLQVSAGAVALSLGPKARPADLEVAKGLFSPLGETVVVPEELMDAVTGLSGSGPAYVALFIEALADGGVRMGLGRGEALKLAAQTVLGTAKMVLQGTHPALLREMVASPGGTTVEGLAVLEERRVRGAIVEAVKAATLRSRELSGDG